MIRSLLLASMLVHASTQCQAQGEALHKLAEIRFDHENNKVRYLSKDHECSFTVDDRGVPTLFEDHTGGNVVDLRLRNAYHQDAENPLSTAPAEGLKEMLDRWDLVYKIVDTTVGVANDLENYYYRSRLAFVHGGLSQARLVGDLPGRFRWGVEVQDALLSHRDFKARIESSGHILETAGWILTANHDLSGLLNPAEGDVRDRLRDHLLLGKTSEKGAGWILSKVIIEPALTKSASALKASFGGQGFGVLDDIALGGSHAGFVANKYAPGIRSSLVGSVVSIGYDAARGKSWDSPEMVGNYLDMALTGLWANTPGLQPWAPHVASIRQIGTELTKDATIKVTKPWFMRDGHRTLRAQNLYSLARMTLSGVDPAKSFAAQPIEFLDNDAKIGRNKHYRALKQAFLTGDKIAAAKALSELKPVLIEGGHNESTIRELQHALDAASRPNLSTDFDGIEKHLGGVSLRALPDWETPMGNLIGLTYDESSGQLVLVGDGDETAIGLSMEDLAAAFACVFGVVQGNTRILGGPEFSLDPEGGDPDSVWQRAVYIPDYLYGTKMGHAMWSADWMLKQYSFGLEVEPLAWINRTSNERFTGHGLEVWGNGLERTFCCRERTFAQSDFKSIPDISQRLAHNRNVMRNRLWIVVKEPVTVRVNGGGLLFGPLTMGVEARRQTVVNGELVDVVDESEQDPAAKEFARQMTARWNEIAAGQPQFQALESGVKAVAVAEWVKLSGAPVNLSWMPQFLSRRDDGVSAVTRLSRQETTTTKRTNANEIVTTTKSYHITGGVDGKVELNPIMDKEAAELAKSVRKSLASYPDKAVFPVRFATQNYTGFVVPTSMIGDSRRTRNRVHTEDGLTYHVNDDNRVTSSIDGSGTVRRYEWENRRLESIQTKYTDGTIITGQRPKSQGWAQISISMSDKTLFDLFWSNQFRKCSIHRNGKPQIKIAEYTASPDDAPISSYVIETHVPSGSIRRAGLDDEQRIVSVDMGYSTENGREWHQRIRFDRDMNGAIHAIRLPDGATTTFGYDPGNSAVDIELGSRRIRVECEPELGLPKYIRQDGAIVGEMQYDSGGLLESFRCKGAEAKFDAGWPKSWARKDGYEQNASYYPNGTIKQISDNREGTMDWFPDGRFRGANLPDGLILRAHYKKRGGNGSPILTSLTFHRR